MNLTRRQALLATGAVICWPVGAQASASVSRMRAGAPLTLRCPGASAYRLEAPGCPPREVRARGGVARLRAPLLPHAEGLAELRCTPLAEGRPCGAPVSVLVLTPAQGFGG